MIRFPQLEQRKCIGCSNKFRVTKESRHKFCSRNCEYYFKLYGGKKLKPKEALKMLSAYGLSGRFRTWA